MIYPPNIESRLAKTVYYLFRQLYVFELGKGKVLGRVTSFLPEATSLYIILKFGGFYDPSKTVIVISFVFFVILSWCLGIVIRKYSIDCIEAQVSAERNPFISEVYEKIVRKKGKKI